VVFQACQTPWCSKVLVEKNLLTSLTHANQLKK
jgi:hypothetical protein